MICKAPKSEWTEPGRKCIRVLDLEPQCVLHMYCGLTKGVCDSSNSWHLRFVKMHVADSYIFTDIYRIGGWLGIP